MEKKAETISRIAKKINWLANEKCVTFYELGISLFLFSGCVIARLL